MSLFVSNSLMKLQYIYSYKKVPKTSEHHCKGPPPPKKQQASSCKYKAMHKSIIAHMHAYILCSLHWDDPNAA